MTLDHLANLCAAAARDVPHASVRETLAGLRYLSDAEREHAARCYAALIGERELPLNIGARHTLKPRLVNRNDRTQARRNAIARRELEARRDGCVLQRD